MNLASDTESRGRLKRLAVIDPHVVVSNAELARPGKNFRASVHKYCSQHPAPGDLSCPKHIFGDYQQVRSAASEADTPDSDADAPASDVDALASGIDAPGGEALGRDCECEAIIRIRHASKCATVRHSGKAAVNPAGFQTDLLPAPACR